MSQKIFNLKNHPEIFEYQTPFFIYDLGLLKQTLNSCLKALKRCRPDAKIHYAVKANHNSTILKTISQNGVGADCVSGNEVLASIESGFAPQEVIFSGVGKTDREIKKAIETHLGSFNAESLQELEIIDGLSESFGKISNVLMRINPNIDAKTHRYITTGKGDNKFGISFRELLNHIDWIKGLKNINFKGLHYHIGSQISDTEVFKNISLLVNEQYGELKNQQIQISDIDLGGGFGIDYLNPQENPIPDFESYFRSFFNIIDIPKSITIHFEPGRSLVGQCGALITRVLYEKKAAGKYYVICDSGMTENLRPALYQAYHKIENLSSKMNENKVYDIVGPICETADFLGHNVKMPETSRGDILAMYSCGAYCEVMSSNYNLREKAPSYFL